MKSADACKVGFLPVAANIEDQAALCLGFPHLEPGETINFFRFRNTDFNSAKNIFSNLKTQIPIVLLNSILPCALLRDKINSQSLEDTQVRNILQNTLWINTLWKNTLSENIKYSSPFDSSSDNKYAVDIA